MSGYFSALMRSMGPVPAGRLPSPVALEFGHDEVAVTAAPTVSTQAAAPGASPAPAATVAAMNSDLPPVPPADAAALPPLATQHPATVVATAPPPTGPPAGRGVVAAAIRWIATGDAAPSVDAAPAAVAGAMRTTPVIVGERLAEAAASRPAVAVENAPDASPRSDDAASAPVAARVADQPRAEATRASEAPPPMSAPETFEVSIGAIHLRVDAPVPQVVARAAPAPVRAPAAPRNGLARRALRRI